MRKMQFAEDEYYHLYNQGVDTRVVFNSKEDYDRFEAYLYLLNDSESPRVANFFTEHRRGEIFTSARGNELVAIGAYCIMRNHFHILATPLVEGGIPQFMQKLLTAYTMYYNDKYDRSGSLFQGTYKARQAKRDANLKYLFAYIHLNPAEMFDENWREAGEDELELLIKKVTQYRYSSMGEYVSSKYVILSPNAFPKYFTNAKDPHLFVEYWLKYSDRFENTDK